MPIFNLDRARNLLLLENRSAAHFPRRPEVPQDRHADRVDRYTVRSRQKSHSRSPAYRSPARRS